MTARGQALLTFLVVVLTLLVLLGMDLGDPRPVQGWFGT